MLATDTFSAADCGTRARPAPGVTAADGWSPQHRVPFALECYLLSVRSRSSLWQCWGAAKGWIRGFDGLGGGEGGGEEEVEEGEAVARARSVDSPRAEKLMRGA